MSKRIGLSLVALVAASPLLVARQTEDTKSPALAVGMPAPPLAVEKWVKGEPIAKFEKGKVYLVEFWATWCGPCIAMMPHLSALQEEYGDKGLRIIGTNIWEREYDAKTYSKVEQFVTDQADRMAYSVAYDGSSKRMDASYMKAAGRKGIPSAFIVDRKGTVAWIGHPGTVDYALSEVVAGTWDLEKGPEREKKVLAQLESIRAKLAGDPARAQSEFEAFATAYPAVAKHQDALELDLLKANGHWDKAYAILSKQVDAAIASKDAMTLNMIAWDIVDPAANVAKRDLELALRAALQANELTGSRDGAILDTVARCYAWKGDLKKAIELQTKAVENAEGPMKAELQKALDEYKAKSAQ